MDEDLDGIERLGLSIGLSIAWVPVLALILNALPWRLHLWPIVVGYLASVFLFSALTLWRRWLLPVDKAYVLARAWHPRHWWHSLPNSDRRIYQFIFLSLILVGAGLAWTFLVPTPDEFMTEFYMLGSDGLAENFPREAVVGQPIGVTLGLVNLERAEDVYRFEVWAADLWTGSRRQLLISGGPYWLARGDQREWPVSWRMPWSGDDQVVEFLLFDGISPTPYRTLRLYLNVTSSKK